MNINDLAPGSYTPIQGTGMPNNGQKMNINSLPQGSYQKQGQRSAFDNAQASLAQSQQLSDSFFKTPMQNAVESNGQNSIERSKGSLKAGMKSFASAGIQNAGPIGQRMTDQPSERQPYLQAMKGFDQATTPRNPSQQLGAADEGIAEFALPAPKIAGMVPKIMEKTGLTNFLANRATQKAVKAVQSTAETMTKGEKVQAASRLVPTFGGGNKFIASETEQNAGKILDDKLTGNPTKNIPIIQNEIATRGTQAEQFLGQNGRPITNEEDFQMFKDAKDKAAKYISSDQMKYYDETIKQFQGELQGMGNMNTGTYYKALKNFEQNVTARLRQGNEALLTDSGSAQLQAAKDVRTAVRDMIGSKHPEFKQQMYDLASLYDARDNTIAKAIKMDSFAKAHPILNKGLTAVGLGAAGAIGVGGIYKIGTNLGE